MAIAYPIDFQRYEGIYEVPEAARYIAAAERQKYLVAAEQTRRGEYKITSRSLIRWIRLGLSLPGLRSMPGRDMLVTFEDLISMRVIAALRAAGVSFPKIYEAENWLRKHTGRARPFAVEAIWTENTDVLAEFKNRLVAAGRAGQMALDVFRDYIIPIHGLTFDEEIAAAWEPSVGVLLDPEIQFGAPCVKGTRVPTRTIWGMLAAGDSRERVARSFRLTEEEINAALRWEDTVAA
ncbi:MAG: DUF433 domain-containing protein [Dehalococcoidia bacterium]|nr:DUF433 domain-containing protein [Dehalococcoidia bacterium]